MNKRENNAENILLTITMLFLCMILGLVLLLRNERISLNHLEEDVESQKQFILDTSTYKCSLTNTLKEDQQ